MYDDMIINIIIIITTICTSLVKSGDVVQFPRPPAESEPSSQIDRQEAEQTPCSWRTLCTPLRSPLRHARPN